MLLLAFVGILTELAASLFYCAAAVQGRVGNPTLIDTAAVAFINFSPAVGLGEFILGMALARIYAERDSRSLRFGAPRHWNIAFIPPLPRRSSPSLDSLTGYSLHVKSPDELHAGSRVSIRK